MRPKAATAFGAREPGNVEVAHERLRHFGDLLQSAESVRFMKGGAKQLALVEVGPPRIDQLSHPRWLMSFRGFGAAQSLGVEFVLRRDDCTMARCTDRHNCC